MRRRHIRFTIRTLFIAIAIVASAMASFHPAPRVEVRSREQAVEVAAALVMQEDATFRPDKQRAKVYQGCGKSPICVDFYSDIGSYVVKRVVITERGVNPELSTFAEIDRVESVGSGRGMYVLDRTGKVIALLPYPIGPNGEVAGVGSIPTLIHPGMSPGRSPTRARESTAPTLRPPPTPTRWASRCRATPRRKARSPRATPS